jgi:hypothetical protein
MNKVSVYFQYVAFTTNVSCVVLLLRIFLLKARYEGVVDHWQF